MLKSIDPSIEMQIVRLLFFTIILCSNALADTQDTSWLRGYDTHRTSSGLASASRMPSEQVNCELSSANLETATGI